jgi:hypothetical protein
VSSASRRALIIAVALAAAGALVIGVAGWLSPVELERSDLEADRAFGLQMPGADELARVSGDRKMTIDGPQNAFAGHIYGTGASAAEVYAFYEAALERLGWRKQPPPFGTTTVELENREYCNPKVGFRLAIEDQARAFQPAFYQGHTYATVFDARLEANPPSAPCPLIPLAPRTATP